jgi:hypothetical protein
VPALISSTIGPIHPSGAGGTQVALPGQPPLLVLLLVEVPVLVPLLPVVLLAVVLLAVVLLVLLAVVLLVLVLLVLVVVTVPLLPVVVLVPPVLVALVLLPPPVAYPSRAPREQAPLAMSALNPTPNATHLFRALVGATTGGDTTGPAVGGVPKFA